MTCAPMLFASCRAVIDTPPVPSVSTVSPAFSRPSTTSARQAVRPEVVIVAASLKLHPSGAWVKWLAGLTTYWQANPSAPSPGEKASHHPVAWLKLADSGANRFDHPRAVRHQDPPIGGRNHPRRYQQIVIIQGGGVERYADLACRRRAGVGKIDKLQIVQ